MSDDQINSKAALISKAIGSVLSQGAAGVLVTLIDLPERGSPDLHVGSKMLARESGERVGTLGAAALDQAVVNQAQAFLFSRADAKSIKLEEFAADLSEFHGLRLLFERIEAEPRLVIAGA